MSRRSYCHFEGPIFQVSKVHCCSSYSNYDILMHLDKYYVVVCFTLRCAVSFGPVIKFLLHIACHSCTCSRQHVVVEVCGSKPETDQLDLVCQLIVVGGM